MGLFDSLLNNLGSQAKSAATQAAGKAANNAVNGVKAAATNAIQNKTRSFTFTTLPTNVEELKALPEAALTDEFAVAALTVLALKAYAQNPQACIDMLNFLKGPQPLSTYEISFLKEHLTDEKARSYFKGATPDNDYQPAMPYTIDVMSLAHSYDQKGEGYCILYVKSGGADNPREIKFRNKPSTNQWFLWEQFLLSGIRESKSSNPWA